MTLRSAGARGMALLLDVVDREAGMLQDDPKSIRIVPMNEAAAIVDYARLRAEYDAVHRRLDDMAALISRVAEALSPELERQVSIMGRWPTLDDVAAAQADLRRLRGEMDMKWREIPHPLTAALRPPPETGAKRLPRS